MGTGGTISGAGRYLKEVSGGRVQVVGADPTGSVYSGGDGRPYLVEGVGEDFWPSTYDPTIADRVIEVSDGDSFAMTRRLARTEALLVGGSCGMATVAATRLAAELDDPDAVIVVLLPDGGRGYLGKIFDDGWLARYGFAPRPEGPVRVVGDVLREKSGGLPDLVHTHPGETVAQAVEILREYGVSQMPVVRAEPPVMAAEVVGSVSERGLLGALFSQQVRLADPVERAMEPPLPTLGATEPVARASSSSSTTTPCSSSTTAAPPASSPARTSSSDVEARGDAQGAFFSLPASGGASAWRQLAVQVRSCQASRGTQRAAAVVPPWSWTTGSVGSGQVPR